MSLIVVESPTKARTFNRILKSKDWGRDYYVFATVGHFRDLPKEELAIDYSKQFRPKYELMANKQKVIEQLKILAKEHKKIILATDLDREGESISYHVAYILGYVKEKWPDFSLENTKNLQRIVFHEITPRALEEALAHPESLRINLVKAQQGRRILDRIVGYELSPLLWEKTGKNWLSAGRVQTVALRLVVEREKEISKFVVEPYFQIFGFFKHNQELKAKLVSKNSNLYETKTKLQLFAGEYEYAKTSISDKNLPEIVADLNTDKFKITNIKEEIVSRFPPPPYTTSLLQQDAFHKFGYSSRLTMRLAQGLYERGLITYHRTDSFNLSTQFVFKAKDFILEKFGKEYGLEKPRGYRTRSRMAQEAHEAIRPTKLDKTPKIIQKEKLSLQQKKLYELIFNRAVATQMKEAQVKQVKVTIAGDKGYEFEAESLQVLFDGFMKLLWPEYATRHQNSLKVTKGAAISLLNLEPQELKTKPPYRYNEASLIKILEDKGIGRPSTYASIISLIQDKHYIVREFRYFIPTQLGTGIADYLAKAFPEIFSLVFTAQMEDNLDKIADGGENVLELLQNFYQPFVKELEIKKKDKETIDIKEDIDEKCPKCGSPLTVKYSRFGKFFPCSNYPKCKYIKPNLQFLANQFCPQDNGRIVIRYTKARKRFYGCENYPKCTYNRWTMKPQDEKEKKTPKKQPSKKRV
ncbi:DNA topoisomerase I [Candidatus Roizmanbacteria bacterium RIFCSPHIGHO2_12_FULL_41_11]|uniref:DNA topoisomerase 1 n=2 Tax=Candidatus Roizmaniibacteriota TaxID=1752723 RepID=A0A1F7JQZ1_9BACT|nr:MAG: DNA topoisomerase I [Candidatus Roizmanbacteria bacterium RIFCSPHIGHO2_12_FULL_41_11]OGK58016.1 MAG: DNA topoisomerase I [Candidatus Roizmanbacteria bacterium RIFCSPLOWO2_02_FULL_41_9]